jgi:hypothetical protein
MCFKVNLWLEDLFSEPNVLYIGKKDKDTLCELDRMQIADAEVCSEQHTQCRFTGLINEVWISQDLA